ncbi:secreted protein [Beggiatoa sp. PS]|nr:secreted protein [Beggiatoa sp. PS]
MLKKEKGERGKEKDELLIKCLFLVGVFCLSVIVQAQEKNDESHALQSQTTSIITDSYNPCNNWKFKNSQFQSDILFYSTGEKWLVHTFNDKGQPNGISKEYNKKRISHSS